MKKLYAPLIATSLLLSMYACNKQSQSGAADPQPITPAASGSSTNPQVPAGSAANSSSNTKSTTGSAARSGDTTVSATEFLDVFNQMMQDLQGSGMSMLIQQNANGDYTIQVIKQPDMSNLRTQQICIDKSGFGLANCIRGYVHDHPNAVLLANNCGDQNPSTWCVYDTNLP